MILGYYIKKHTNFLNLFIGVIISFLIVQFYFVPKRQFDQLALGEETRSHFAMGGQYPIHIQKLNDASLLALKQGWEERGKKDCIVFLGNSQMHAINQMHEGETTFVEVLQNKIKQLNVAGVSFPNANLQEHLLAFTFLKDYLNTRYVVLPVFMDDLREDGIRGDGSFQYLKEQGFAIQDDSAICKKVNHELHSQENNAAGNTNDLAALNQTVQEKTERLFNGYLETHSQVWRNRTDVRGEIFSTLYLLRNTVLGINAQTKRLIIPQKYEDNINALKVLLKISQANGIKVLLYIPPIRQDVEPPYEKSDYLHFKEDLKSIAAQFQNVTYADYDAIVPGQYWGVKNSTNIGGKVEYDFMHFQYGGHLKLADALYSDLSKILQ